MSVSNNNDSNNTGLLSHFFGNFGSSTKSADPISASDDIRPIDADRTAQLARGGANNAEFRNDDTYTNGGAKHVHNKDQFTVRDDDWFAAAHPKNAGAAAADSTIPAFSSLRTWWAGGSNKTNEDASVTNLRRNRADSLTDRDFALGKEGSSNGSYTGLHIRDKAMGVVEDVKDRLTPTTDESLGEKVSRAGARVSGWTPLSRNPTNDERTNKGDGVLDRDALGFTYGGHGWGSVIDKTEDVDPDYRTYQREAESIPSSGAYYNPRQEGPHNNWATISDMYQKRYVHQFSTAKHSGAGLSAMGADAGDDTILLSGQSKAGVNEKAFLPTVKRIGRAVLGEKKLFGFNNDNAYFGNNTSGMYVDPKDGTFLTVAEEARGAKGVSLAAKNDNTNSTAVASAAAAAGGVIANAKEAVVNKASNLLSATGIASAGAAQDDDYSPSVTPVKRDKPILMAKEGAAVDDDERRFLKMKSNYKAMGPQDPSELTAFRHSDCAPQLEGYEKCLDVNAKDYDKCKQTWDMFATCQEKLML